MKTKLITSLKSRVLLVDGKIFDYEIFKHGIHLSDEDHKTDFIDGNWSLLGKLKDLTDKDCEGLVEGNNGDDESTMWFDYTQPKTCFFCFTKNTPKESFLSALEAEGLHLNGNPHKKSHFSPEEFIQEEYEIFMESEQNVFSENTLIFVEQ